jgi:hypothetical protein
VFPALLHRICALYLAANYFAFQIELFEEEYEQNHRKISETCSFAAPTLNWETFDKNNAPKAFTLQPVAPVEVLFQTRLSFNLQSRIPAQRTPIRDKSPPETRTHS